MGFFEMLKGMLEGRQEQEALNLTLASALEQLEALSGKIERGFDEQLNTLSERFTRESGKTRSNLRKLEQGSLLNKDVETRHLQIMEGNRKSYIRKIEQFLDAVAEATPLERGKARQAAEYLRERLEGLLRSTQKSYFVLQEFLANESRNLAGNLKAFDRLVSELKDSLDSRDNKLSRIETARAQLAGADSRPEREEGLRKSAQGADDAAAEAEQALEEFRRGKSYRELAELRQQQEQFRQECDGLTDWLAQSLSIIERAMRKYLKMSVEPEMVSRVLDSSGNVLLLEPERLGLLLPRLERAISSGEVSLKDKKREKSLEAIHQLKKELPGLAERFKRLDTELRSTEKMLGKHAAASEEKKLLARLEEGAVRARMARESLNTYLDSREEQPEMDVVILEKELAGLFGRGVRLKIKQDALSGDEDHNI